MPFAHDLSPLLALVESPQNSTVEYLVGGSDLLGADREAAAQLLADDAMRIACGESAMLARWRARRDGGPPETGARLDALKTYVGIGFGSPEGPVSRDHLQGLVAELLWNRLVQERTSYRDGRSLVRAHSVKADPLEPGGDGLAVFEDENGVLFFRLWEIKKHNAQSRVSSTINRASKQLRKRGHEYLAKLAGPETMSAEGVVRELYEGMVDLWFDRSERAGVGVAIGTSVQFAPAGPSSFGSLRRKFPEFTGSNQTESVVVAVPDFPGFAERIEGIVWSGL